MKKFRVKNLTVAVDSATELQQQCGVNFSCPVGSIDCGFPTIWTCTITMHCPTNSIINCPTRSIIQCPARSLICPTNSLITCPATSTIVFNENLEQVNPADRGALIAELKQDLTAALKELDVAEVQAQADGAPQTLEEADQLQDSLEDALKEVKKMKKKLK